MSYSKRIFKGPSRLDFINDYVVVDIETTGLSPEYDSIIEIGAVKVKNNEIVDSFSELVFHDKELSFYITKLTGIKSSDLLTARHIEEVLSSFDEFIADNVIIGHNVHFDYNFLYDNYIAHLDKPLTNGLIDTMRLAKNKIFDIEDYKLKTVLKYFNINNTDEHRALSDAICTQKIYEKLEIFTKNYKDLFLEKYKDSLNFDDCLFNEKVCIKGSFKNIDRDIANLVLEITGCKTYDSYFDRCTYILTTDKIYENIKNSKTNKTIKNNNDFFPDWKVRAIENEKNGTVKIISESQFCEMFNIPIFEKANKSSTFTNIKISELSTKVTDFDTTHPLYNKNCIATGTLINLGRKELYQEILDVGGIINNSVTKQTDYLILGNNDYNPILNGKKSSKHLKAEKMQQEGHKIKIIPENILYDILADNE